MASYWAPFRALPALLLLTLPLSAGVMHIQMAQYDTLQLVPSVEYRKWWQEMEDCSGRRRDMSTVRFFMVPGEMFRVNTMEVIGLYDIPRHDIYVAQTEAFKRETVGHEMLHALGVISHRNAAFEECGVS